MPRDQAFPDSIAARWLHESASTHLIGVDQDGVVTYVNAVAGAALGFPVGHRLDDFVAQECIDALAACHREPALVTFCSRDLRYTLRCRMFGQGAERWFVGEPIAADAELEDALLRTNDALAVLVREQARQAAELREAMAQRDRAEWTLKRVGEVLPICMECGSVATSPEGNGWRTAADFIRDAGIPLSHGFCPDCATAALREARAL